MFGIKKKSSITNVKASCSTCIYSEVNEDFDLICNGKKEVESDSSCRKYKIDITKTASKRNHTAIKKQYHESDFEL
ncbi:MAG: hypothetical protein PHE51_01615 [Eubacteriales bacterium]|nr:hypothetical protein [Eubacteriales bacterium]